MLLRVKYELRKHQRAKTTVPKIFQDVVRRHPDKVALVYEATDEKWTFKRLDEYSNAVANFFYQQGYQLGDVIAIFMESRPEYVGLWLGMAKVGIEAALINFNLRLDSLVYCVTTSGAKAVIFGGELSAGESLRSLHALWTTSWSSFLVLRKDVKKGKDFRSVYMFCIWKETG